ncbi:hypothetical protein Q4485_05310 [Granulosicoccaceae sp. 1_MG-2023]|nr:hypothetical protein [Granulosicoccaceae sp. 1_MG-2023]
MFRSALHNRLKRWLIDAGAALALILCGFAARDAQASWLDDDFYCRIYGCIVVGDGNAYDVYDVYRFSGGGVVAAGEELIPWVGNPYEGGGTVDMLESGTLTPASASFSGDLLGIDTDGDGIAELSPFDSNNSGVLDMGDSLPAFGADSTVNFSSANGATHSLYIAARVDFSVYMRAGVASGEGNLAADMPPESVGFAVSVNQQGNDSGLSYGSRAVDPDFYAVSGINSLADIWQIPTEVAQFRRSSGTHSRRATDVADQAVRLDVLFDAPAVGLEAGAGSVEYDIELRFYNR